MTVNGLFCLILSHPMLRFAYITPNGTRDSKARNDLRYFHPAHEPSVVNWILVIVEYAPKGKRISLNALDGKYHYCNQNERTAEELFFFKQKAHEE